MMEQHNEHKIYLIFDYQEGGDPLPTVNGRYMTPTVGWNILSEEMKTVKQLGKERLVIEFKGGDPTRRFAELEEFCEWAWHGAEAMNLSLQFELAVDIQHFAPEHGDWYIEHARDLILWARCKKLDQRILEFAQVFHSGIVYEMDLRHPEKIVPHLFEIQSRKIPLRLQFTTPFEEWSEELVDRYDRLLFEELRTYLPESKALPWVQSLKRIQKAKEGKLGDLNYGCCYDTNGWKWTCPALSPLHLHSWEMDEERLQELEQKQSKAAFRWVCPGEMLEWKEQVLFLEEKQKNEYAFAAAVAAKGMDADGKRMLKDWIAEAAQNKE